MREDDHAGRRARRAGPRGEASLLGRMLRCRRGSILTVTALTLPIVLVTTAFCVDLGRLYLGKTKAEVAASLAVEAALERRENLSDAQEIARRVALSAMNGAGFVRDLEVILASDASSMTVTVRMDVKTAFSGIFGLNHFPTGAHAKRPLS